MKMLLVFLFSLLVLPNLGARPLWQDEAETALVARQMVNSNTWLPYAYDDQGPISQDWNYQFKISSLWRWHPWFQFYVAAASLKLLGISAFSARLPFAILGIAAYWYFLNFLSRNIEGWRAKGPRSSARSDQRGRRSGVERDRTPTEFRVFFLTASILFLFSTPLLLHFRQARYYSLSLFFTLLTIDGYLNMKRRLLAVRPGVSSKYSMKYILGSVLLFHSFLPGALALQISFWIHQIRSLLAERQGDSLMNTKRFAIAFSVSLLFTLPWAIWLKIGGQNLNFSPELIKQHLVQHYSYIHKFIFPAFIFLPLLSSKLRTKFFRDDKLSLFSIFISISLLLYTFNHPYFFRYLIPLIPLFIYIAAWIIANAKPVWSLIPLISLIIMTVKTFPNYLFEITQPYRGANTEIIGFLSSLDPEKYQKLAVNYDDFTFRFHTSFTVYGAQHLNYYKTSEWKRVENGIFETIEEEPSKTLFDLCSRGDDEVSEDTKPSVSKKCRRDSPPSRLAVKQLNCPDVVIIFPDWGNDTLLKEIAKKCQLETFPLPLHYAKLADDPDSTNHQFTQPPLGTLEVFLAPPSPS